MEIKLFDSERKVMEALWECGALPAGQLAKILKMETGWNRNTTYTVIKKCIEKGAIERLEPNFICRATISREQAQETETKELIDKMFSGSEELFLSSFFSNKRLTGDQIERLKKIVNDLK